MAKESKDKEEGVAEEQATQQDVVWPQITLVTAYYISLGFLLAGNLVSIWPESLGSSTPASERVTFFFQTLLVSNEVRLILIVTMAGALGSLVHGFRSLFWYVGNHAYVKSWTLMYLLLPFVGSTLSLIFYFILRGGLFSPQATVEATSPFGFAGIAGLVGMFSNKAALKLQEIAESIFSTQQTTKGTDNVDLKKDKDEK
ncbi:MAG TPA: hypothetical protein VLT51_11850 [Anaerolineales bacterium]|nr:hypothetical protein [Anaerolineales bacterium]